MTAKAIQEANIKYMSKTGETALTGYKSKQAFVKVADMVFTNIQCHDAQAASI